ncbi:MAG: PAS domain S-box protein [Propioniciclava sp.]
MDSVAASVREPDQAGVSQREGVAMDTIAASDARRDIAIVRAAMDAIVSFDRTGTIVEFNPAAEKLFGWTREETIGKHLRTLIVPADAAAAEVTGLARYLATGEDPVLDTRIEVPTRRRDNTPIHLEVQIVRTGVSESEQFTVFSRDITDLVETRRRLEASQQRYEAIIRHTQRAKILCGSATEVSYLIAGAAMLGYAEGQTLPAGFLDLVHPDDLDQAEAFIAAMRRGTGLEEPADLRLRAFDGGYRVCEVVGEDLSDLPAVGGFLITAEDVTADRQRRQQLEDRNAQMRALINNLDTAVVLEDENRSLLVVNQRMTDMFGIPVNPEDLVGADCARSAEDVKHLFADPVAFVAAVDEALREGEPRLGEQLTLATGGTLERHYVPIRSGNRPVGHLWVYRDITQQILETQLLADQNRSLEELASLKNEFVARVSHELRSPLTSVVSFADLLASSSEVTAEQSSFIDIILRNAQRLLRLIEDLLLVAKLESHTLPLSLGLVDLPALVNQVVTELGPQVADPSTALSFSSEPGPRVRGDAVRLQQVATNLIRNAIAYTPAGGTIEVKVLPDPALGSWRVTVSDTGVGIDPEELARVFDAFYRAEGSQKSPSGTGLGLAIARLIIAEHHGEITVDSTAGVGTTMTVLLPFEEL